MYRTKFKLRIDSSVFSELNNLELRLTHVLIFKSSELSTGVRSNSDPLHMTKQPLLPTKLLEISCMV